MKRLLIIFALSTAFLLSACQTNKVPTSLETSSPKLSSETTAPLATLPEPSPTKAEAFITYDMILRKHAGPAISYRPPILMSYQAKKNAATSQIQSLQKALSDGAKTGQTLANLDRIGLELKPTAADPLAVDLFSLDKGQEKLAMTVVLYKDPLILHYVIYSNPIDMNESVYEISDPDRITEILRSLRLHAEEVWPPASTNEQLSGMYLGYHKYKNSSFMPQLFLGKDGTYSLSLSKTLAESGHYTLEHNVWGTILTMKAKDNKTNWQLGLGTDGMLICQEERLDIIPYGGQFEKIN